MSHAERWLHTLGHALAAHALYGEGHQARREAGSRLYEALGDLLRADHRPTFTFLEDAVIYRSLPVHGMRDWVWGRRLGAVGIRRLEFTHDAALEGISGLLVTLHQRLSGEAADGPWPRWAGIEVGDVIRGAEGLDPEDPRVRHQDVVGLREEVEAMRFVCARVAGGDPLPADVVAGIVRALTVALHGDGELLLPLLPLHSPDQYLASHAINSAVLAMGFSEWLGLGSGAARAVGRAALLHDIGMTRVPPEVFRDTALTDSGRSGVARHPEAGARLLLAGSPDLDLAATTAYEHHLRVDGAGYPARRLHQDLHYISRLVAVCGAYDALCSERCYRPARDPATALGEIEAAAGSAYDAALAGSFVEMMRRWEDRRVMASPA